MTSLACPFCLESESSSERLRIHCLAHHPVPFLRARERAKTAGGHKDAASGATASRAEEPPWPDVPPLADVLAFLRDQTAMSEEGQELSASAQPHTEEPASSEGKKPPDTGPQRGSLPDVVQPSEAKRGEPSDKPAQASSFSKDTSSSSRQAAKALSSDTGSCQQKGPRGPQWVRRTDSWGPQWDRLAAERVEEAAVDVAVTPNLRPLAIWSCMAPRCRHNARPCLDFPHCSGRRCMRLHPPCYDGRCERTNLCAFEHAQYEKTCDICPNSVPEAGSGRMPVRCPHRRAVPCKCVARGVRCLHGSHCNFAHGPCPQGWECPDWSVCGLEHPGQVFFCPPCWAVADQWNADLEHME